MKTIVMTILTLLISCNGGGGGGKSSDARATLNPDLKNATWVMSYIHAPEYYEDRITVTDDEMIVETYCSTCPGTPLLQRLDWDLRAIDNDTAEVDTGTDVLRFDYEISGNQLDVYFEDGDHNTYLR